MNLNPPSPSHIKFMSLDEIGKERICMSKLLWKLALKARAGKYKTAFPMLPHRVSKSIAFSSQTPFLPTLAGGVGSYLLEKWFLSYWWLEICVGVSTQPLRKLRRLGPDVSLGLIVGGCSMRAVRWIEIE